MENIVNTIKIMGGAVGMGLAWFFGKADTMFIALTAMVVTDYVTGIIAAGSNKRLNSSVGFKGIARKLFIFVLVGMGTLLDKLIPDANGIIRAAVCGFYIANEGLSILENAGKLDLPLPAILKNMLEQLNKDDKTNKD